MREPGALVKLAGWPPATFVLLLGVGFVEFAFYVGHLLIWPALTGLAVGIFTMKAAFQMRQARRNRVSWDAMGNFNGAASTPKKGFRWSFLFYGLVVFFGVPFALKFAPNHHTISSGLVLIWALVLLSAGVWVVVKIAGASTRAVRGSMSATKERQSKRAYAAPVSWTLGRAGSAPSRNNAMRQLPDYTRRLMQQSKVAPRLGGAKNAAGVPGLSRP